ncbi:flagellar biosynthesis anti-sigma factor FlgM [Pinirhizobacter soli]|uniref:flagellar biosynthesis anti-sigma factor FlgM n=1 Tax=Pinirhizobacter soli TaxID=2786953 RepID=UPI00202A0DF5|nr:flagellar biosynthesis anti-sigma factor FlgM [Pinirhizobacter soli]
MNTTIKTGITPQQTQPKAPSAAAGQPASADQVASTVKTSDDSISLTSSAQALGQASKAGDVMDTHKVEAIRQQLASGTYQINPGAIATNLLKLEGQLGGQS